MSSVEAIITLLDDLSISDLGLLGKYINRKVRYKEKMLALKLPPPSNEMIGWYRSQKPSALVASIKAYIQTNGCSVREARIVMEAYK